MKTVVSIKFGSHLYGTNTPESDLDFKAVHLPDARDILLQRVKGSICDKRLKGEGEKNLAGEVDQESYSLQRYLQLLVEGQTVAIDMLFAPDNMILKSSELWERLRTYKRKFLTKKSAAFVGYCRTQANKYGIKGSRVAAARDAASAFQRIYEQHGTTPKVREFVPILNDLVSRNPVHTAITFYDDPKGIRQSETYFECCNRKVPFTATVKLAWDIYQKVHDAYGIRAQLAEQNEGVDWKALSHAVRVGQEALELLNTGTITFPLQNAVHILDIKKGRINYDTVAMEIEELLLAVEDAAPKSALREEADLEFIDNLVAFEYGLVISK